MCCFFFFKQKTAYEMRISDWSSDVCSSDLVPTLVERDLVLYAASVVSEYLDERYPHPPLMPVDPLSRARLRLAMLRLEHDWVPQVQAIQFGTKQQSEVGRKRLKELLTASVPLFKASKFFLNPEMSLADCAMAPIVWRLDALGVSLPKDRKSTRRVGKEWVSTCSSRWSPYH